MPCKNSNCLGCPLHAHGNDFSDVEGSGRNGVLVVAEASGEGEARDGLPLRPWSPAGGVFERVLRRLSLDRNDFAITNMVRCRPRGNLLDHMPYESRAVAHCSTNLVEAYMRYQPRVILALGGIAFNYLTGMGGTGQTISHLRGYVFNPMPSYSPKLAEDADQRGVVVLPTYHPSFIRRGSTHLFGVLARDVMRAVNIAAGRDNSFLLDDPLMAYYREELAYILKPTVDEGWAYYHKLRDRPDSPISYDLETFESDSLDEDMREEFSDTRIRQAQLSVDEGEGIALPWNEDFRKIWQAVMALPNPKIGWNNSGFDDRVLRAVSDAIGQPGIYLSRGPVHDAMLMWKRWQPELPANLQYASTFVQFPFPWKHLNVDNLPFYGCCDTDAALRNFHMLSRSMAQKGILQLYHEQVADLHQLPAKVAKRGVELSRDATFKIAKKITSQQAALMAEMDALYPESERTYSPEEGYKKAPKEVEERRRLWNSEKLGILIGERTVLDGEREADYVRRMTSMVERTFQVKVKQEGGLLPKVMPLERWCKPNPFSPQSRPMIIRYAKLKRHEVPTKKKPDGTVSESLTLEDIDLMFGRTRDPLYRMIGSYRRLTEERKLVTELELLGNRSDVHSTFHINHSGEIGSRNPALPEPLGALGGAVVARPGHVMVLWRWEGQWERVLAGLTGDIYLAQATLNPSGMYPTYQQEGIHPAALRGFLRGESDRAVLDANRIAFGTSLKSIMDMRKTFNSLSPKVAAWQQEVCRQAHAQLSLTSRFGEIRWFYEVYAPDGRGGLRLGEQAQSAIQFLPEADCVGAVKWRLRELGITGDWEYIVGYGRDWIMCEVKADDMGKHVRRHYNFMSKLPPHLEPPRQLAAYPSLPVTVLAGTSWGQMTKLTVR
jgi:uracil-DNA glycosylase family 4